MSDRGESLLAMVGLTPEDVARFRGARVEGDLLRVETRLGAGNAECQTWPGQSCEEAGCYHLAIDRLRALPNYVRDEEDWGDRTYRYFYFAPAAAIAPQQEGTGE